MPLYEYKCLDCKKTYAKFRPMARREDPVDCPYCEGMGKLNAAPRPDIRTKRVRDVTKKV